MNAKADRGEIPRRTIAEFNRSTNFNKLPYKVGKAKKGKRR